MAYIRGPFVRLFFFVAIFLLSHSLISVEASRRRHSSHHPKSFNPSETRPRRERLPCTATYTRVETYISTEYVDITPTVTQVATQINVVTSTETDSTVKADIIFATTTVTSATYTIPAVVAATNIQKRSISHRPHHFGHFCNVDTSTTTIVSKITRTTDPVTVTSVVSETDTKIVEETDVDIVKTTTTTTIVVVPTQNAYLCSSDLFKSDVKFSYSIPSGGDIQITISNVDSVDSASDCCVACFALNGCVAWTHDSNCTVSAITVDPNGQCGIPEVSFTGADVGGVSGMGPCGVLGSG